tara:strand:+ start:796 stop:984 length:189 start_codon:yes stop_codon:yes gene_type:complete
MKICDGCPFPRRCEPQQRCIVYKIGAEPVIMPEPTPVPVKTTNGIGMTGAIKQTIKKKAKIK